MEVTEEELRMSAIKVLGRVLYGCSAVLSGIGDDETTIQKEQKTFGTIDAAMDFMYLTKLVLSLQQGMLEEAVVRLTSMIDRVERVNVSNPKTEALKELRTKLEHFLANEAGISLEE